MLATTERDVWEALGEACDGINHAKQCVGSGYSKSGLCLDCRKFRKSVRQYLKNESRTIAIGRSRHTAGVGTGTPIEVQDGDGHPVLHGQPYLKTQFRRGNFSKTLYTASTLHITVGRDWDANP